MTIILGIESTAHTFGIGIVRDEKVLANIKKTYTTEKGGIIPTESAKFHEKNKEDIYKEALEKAEIKEKNIDAIAFSQGPGLSPCLLVGLKFAKKLALKLNKPLVPINHCISHLEIGKITGAKDPVMLYVSGANTQVIAYEAGKYRIFGETLDIGTGNFIDTFARYAGIGFPGGPVIQKLAEQSKNYIELPYKVKGMDVAFSGILTNLKQKLERINLHSQVRDINSSEQTSSCSSHNKIINRRNSAEPISEQYKNKASDSERAISRDSLKNETSEIGSREYTLSDLAFSMQEIVFAMLVETAERALAHTGKKELLLGGGVACNTRLQEMCRIMCEERGAKLFVPENSLLVDNGAMIAFLGEIMFKKEIKIEKEDFSELDIKPRQRTDGVNVEWR